MRTYVATLTGCLIVAACGGSDDAPDTEKPDPRVERLQMIATGEEYAGKSLEEWAIEYMRWSYSQTTCESAADDSDGSLCALYQDTESPVFFLERSSLSASEEIPLAKRTRCHVPSGKAILVPVAAMAFDNVGAEEPDPEDVLEGSAQTTKDSLRGIMLKVGGKTMDDLDAHSVGPLPFEYTVPTAPNYYTCSGIDDIEDAVVKPSYFVGNVALFKPPAPGSYNVEYASELTYYNFAYGFHVKASITVDPADR